jgi:hypothetical protein
MIPDHDPRLHVSMSPLGLDPSKPLQPLLFLLQPRPTLSATFELFVLRGSIPSTFWALDFRSHSF